MTHHLPKIGLALLAAFWSSPLAAGETPPRPVRDARALAVRIDELLASHWAANSVQPAARTDDAEFFRRLCLDLTGRIPSITHLIDFLDDRRADKRAIWTERLMGGGDPDFPSADNPFADLYVQHWATFWRQVIFAQTSQEGPFAGFQLEPWLQQQVRDNRPYDQLVRDLLTRPEVAPVFLQANSNQPENLAGNVARLFLGVKLECAQCHDDRSGGNWTRTQFWEFAAFFTPVAGRRGQEVGKIKVPGSGQLVAARYLGGPPAELKAGANPPAVLAGWLTAADNPFFARATVNRLWFALFGTGLTDPVDHMATEGNPPSHPELLDELAFQFTAHQFDLRYLLQALFASRAYQLSSQRTDASQDDPRLFARAAVRGLTPEQLYDSFLEATGLTDPTTLNPNYRFNVGGGTPRGDFLLRFSSPIERRTEAQTSILQALFLMNGQALNDLVRNSPALQTVQDNTRSALTRNIEELYLVTLSRKPTAAERERLVRYVQGGGPAGNRRAALGDVFWALLNSAEFVLNH